MKGNYLENKRNQQGVGGGKRERRGKSMIEVHCMHI
jgi:hypothetical protein